MKTTPPASSRAKCRIRKLRAGGATSRANCLVASTSTKMVRSQLPSTDGLSSRYRQSNEMSQTAMQARTRRVSVTRQVYLTHGVG